MRCTGNPSLWDAFSFFLFHTSPSSLNSHAIVPSVFAAQISSIPIVDDNDSLLDVYSRRSVLVPAF